jgi:Helix-turn-helix domain
LSRSAFIERFTGRVGVPPIRYLTIWRLQTARLRLRESPRSIGQIAHAVGYAAEEAFSRAFSVSSASRPDAGATARRRSARLLLAEKNARHLSAPGARRRRSRGPAVEEHERRQPAATMTDG